MLKASNYTAWPDAGGFWDQDSFIIRDILTFLALERRLEYEDKEREGEKQSPAPVEEFDFGR